MAARRRHHAVGDLVLGVAVRAGQPHRHLGRGAGEAAELGVLRSSGGRGRFQAAAVAPGRRPCITRAGRVSEKLVIELDDVGFSFGRTPVLHGTTLTLEPGSLNVLVGASGAGKSTLLRLCYLDLAPTQGQVRLFGRPVARRNRDATATLRQAIGVLPQDRRMLEHLPLIDNVALPLRVSGGAEGRGDDLRALLEWVGAGGPGRRAAGRAFRRRARPGGAGAGGDPEPRDHPRRRAGRGRRPRGGAKGWRGC